MKDRIIRVVLNQDNKSVIQRILFTFLVVLTAYTCGQLTVCLVTWTFGLGTGILVIVAPVLFYIVFRKLEKMQHRRKL